MYIDLGLPKRVYFSVVRNKIIVDNLKKKIVGRWIIFADKKAGQKERPGQNTPAVKPSAKLFIYYGPEVLLRW